MIQKKLMGALLKGTVGTKNGDGKVVDPSMAIFPILKQTKDGNFHLIGTGFFITDNGLFATAKHVLLDVLDANKVQTHPIFLVQFLDNGYVIRPILRCTSHELADISIGIAVPMNNNISGNPLKNKLLELTQSVPDVGEVVCTYAYPKSVIIPGEMHFYTDFFEGAIQKVYPNGRDKIMMPGPCAQTSIYIHGGASGGPVFDSSGKVFGVNSTGFENEGLSFVTLIRTIENLQLEDVFIPGNNTGKVSVRELVESSFISYERTA
jgi:Trypsin-like peptidase domain